MTMHTFSTDMRNTNLESTEVLLQNLRFVATMHCTLKECIPYLERIERIAMNVPGSTEFLHELMLDKAYTNEAIIRAFRNEEKIRMPNAPVEKLSTVSDLYVKNNEDNPDCTLLFHLFYPNGNHCASYYKNSLDISGAITTSIIDRGEFLAAYKQYIGNETIIVQKKPTTMKQYGKVIPSKEFTPKFSSELFDNMLSIENIQSEIFALQLQGTTVYEFIYELLLSSFPYPKVPVLNFSSMPGIPAHMYLSDRKSQYDRGSND